MLEELDKYNSITTNRTLQCDSKILGNNWVYNPKNPFLNYLFSQRVVIGQNAEFVKSNILDTNVSIPQSRFIGPIVFVIYINDLCSVAIHSNQSVINYTCLLIQNCSGNDYTQFLGILVEEYLTWENQVEHLI